MKKKREINVFSLSFLDIMCCGFGAVVLLVMLLNGQTLQKREDAQEDLRSELERVTMLKEYASDDLYRVQNDIENIKLEEADLKVQADQLRNMIAEKHQENDIAEKNAQQQHNEIVRMEKEKALIEKFIKDRKKKPTDQPKGDNLVGFDGDGRRQYLTGLKLGGNHTLILVDVSASMLDETIVNIIRRKFMNESTRRQSPKWLRVVRSLHWIIANLQSDKHFQVYYFNTKAQPVIAGTERQWLNTSNTKIMADVISSVQRLAPHDGTNLHSAFFVIDQMKPKPDSVLLLTDGLPTQGTGKQISAKITAAERQTLFDSAVKRIPKGVPINTLLYPLEGDPTAASSYWELAISTKGSFITPSRDWP